MASLVGLLSGSGAATCDLVDFSTSIACPSLPGGAKQRRRRAVTGLSSEWAKYLAGEYSGSNHDIRVQRGEQSIVNKSTSCSAVVPTPWLPAVKMTRAFSVRVYVVRAYPPPVMYSNKKTNNPPECHI